MVRRLRPSREGFLRGCLAAALIAFAVANERAFAAQQSDVDALPAHLKSAYEAYAQRDWKNALENAEFVRRTALAELKQTDAGDKDTRRWLAECGGRADWVAAHAESGLGDWNAALRRAARISESWPDANPSTRSLAETFRAGLLIDFGVPDQAVEPLKQAMSLCDQEIGKDPYRDYGAFFDAYLGEAERLLAIGRYRDVLTQVERTQSKLEWDKVVARMNPVRAGASRARIESLRGVALTELARTESDAREQARKAFALVLANADALHDEKVFAATSLAQISLSIGELESAARELEVMDRLRAEPSSAAPETEDLAWVAALRARYARLHGDDASAAHAELRTQLTNLIGEWREIVRPGGVGFLRFARARMYLVEALLGANEAEDLEIALESQEFGVLWQGLGRPTPTVAEMRASLCAEDVGCLVYVIGPDESVLLALDARTTRRFPLPPASWLFSHATDLRRARLNAQKNDDATRLANELADKLVPAGAREMLAHWKHMRVIGREQFGDAPAQALLLAGGRPLVQTLAVSELPSLPIGHALARRRAANAGAASKSILIAAPTPPPETLARFEVLRAAALTAKDVQPLSAVFDAKNTFLEDRASFQALAEACREARDVYVVAHGVQDHARELRSMIALAASESARDGLLTIERLRDLKLPDVAVLLVCRAADGVDRAGDAGASDLAGAALLAGASTVIAADRDLRLSDALAYGRAFRAERDGGATTAEAAKRALANLLSREPVRGVEDLPFVYGLGQ